ncbi:hypothetical protein GCM10011613_36070 [Cellvibrio zantedeschiae]|uniref:DUF3570 domain-containing protein n=1 Tax=Cellvibrio zantedeschiae TaxID=1237077 RepID=A0ABQ3BBA0_9GAMM|nr:hypothetical protein GCM10011613_36070 [Cellvibrio zantedeschiae]
MVVREAVVVAINFFDCKKMLRQFALVVCALSVVPVFAAVLPDERVDILEHQYDGGGIQVTGPSILVRKNIGKSVSVSANYYVDMVSSASIDVLASASRYSEERKQKSVSVDYMFDRTNFSLGYTTSDENDYQAKTYNLGVTQSFFGDLTTLNFGFSFGQDVVGRNLKGVPDPDFHLDKEQRRYSLNLSQILTKNLIAEISLESGSEACINMAEGETCLNNPYRSYSYLQNGVRALALEKYPLTHNSDAGSLRAIYHLPYSASVRADVRRYTDSWGITATNAEVRYIHDFKKDLLVEVKYRVYSQTEAEFYSDLFPYKDAQNFMARDKELSPFSSKTIGLGLTYKFPWTIPGVDKSTANLFWDHMKIDYEDFRDYANFGGTKAPASGYKVGEEPLYTLDADVIRFYLSFWF